MKTNPDDCINPVVNQCREGYTEYAEFGLTKREFFAAMAMQGLVLDKTIKTTNSAAEFAVNYADALIEALNKEEK